MSRKLLAVVCLLGAFIGAAHARHICPILCGSKTNAVVLWTPLNLATTVAWWDAQSLSATPVSSWTDKKGGVVASQATGANQPTWSATAQNGKPGVSFNGTTQFLNGTGTGLPQGTSFTVAAAAIATNGPIFEYGTTSNSTDVQLYSFSNNARCGLNTLSIQSSTNWSANNRFVECINAAGSGVLWVDGVNSGTGAFAAAVPVGQTFSIAKPLTGAGMMTGTVQQIVVASTSLTTGQQQCLEGWESWYDGKAGANLPVAHPYKAAAPTTTSNCT